MKLIDLLKRFFTKQTVPPIITEIPIRVEYTDNPEKYWNEKWPRSTIAYKARGDKVIDIRNIFAVNIDEEEVLRKLVKSIEHTKTDEEKALYCFDYVVNRTKYQTDDKTQNVPEFWQTPYETFISRIGDCEDLSILILKLMALAGVPASRRKLCAGYVIDKKGNKIGHAYPIFLADDKKWYVLDPTFYPEDTKKYFKIKEHKERSEYQEIWFTANEFWAWIQENFIIEDQLKQEKSERK